jgi:hypothetical protein
MSTTTDELLATAEPYAASFDKGALPLPPARKVAVPACMEARLKRGFAYDVRTSALREVS